jgi:CheY-like chemotaxis protein/two-component sensor histidine kinase
MFPVGEVGTRLYRAGMTELTRDELLQLLASERAARAEAEAANRSKDEFLAMLSHELRTPLTAVAGWTRMLRNTPLDRDATARALEAIERNTVVQTQLINDLLDVSRIITGKFELKREPVFVHTAIEAALDTVAEAATRKRITIETALDPGAAVLGDEMRLAQIVTNLLTNAVKFTPDGGRVGVRLEEIGGDVLLTVEDSGVGIAPDSGLTLGLAIVQHLVKHHGGTVAVVSGDAGARFTVVLPRLEGARTATVRRTQEVVAPHDVDLRDVNVLVVDDDPDGRDVIGEILRTKGADVLALGSAEEALSVLARRVPDVLVSDIGLGGIDGLGLLRRVRALPGPVSAVPAIALTAYARPEDRVRAFGAGFQIHITKPIEPTELQAAVARLTSQSRAR